MSKSILGRVGVSALAAALVSAWAAGTAGATWSIVAVDPETREVGVAVASCVAIDPKFLLDKNGVILLTALAADAGAGISQAEFNVEAPPKMVEQLKAGASASDTLAAVTATAFDPDSQARQHAVIRLDAPNDPAVFTGTKNPKWAGSKTSSGVSVQGNTLVSESVVADALGAYQSAAGSLESRLAAGLLAGSRAGGDERCGAQTALFANVAVAESSGRVRAKTMQVELGDGKNPTEMLAEALPGESSATDSSGGAWPWIGGGAVLVLLAAVAIVVWRRSRSGPT